MKSNTVKALIGYGRSRLKDCGIDTYMLDARVLLKAATGLGDVEIITRETDIINDHDISVYMGYLDLRCRLMPVQYILGQCEFMALEFFIDENVLIPRADTEILVEACISKIKENGYTEIVEIGVGSGCISVSLGWYLPHVNIVGGDVSVKALETAKINNIKNHTNDRVVFLESDLFKGLGLELNSLDMVVSNPPYIRKSDIKNLECNVKNYEPIIALDGGEGGLDFYINIAKEAHSYLKTGGMVAFEIGFDQGQDVRSILEENYDNINILKDLAGLDRAILATKR